MGVEPAAGPRARPRSRDVVDTVLGFARTLRHAGVVASPDRVEAMLAAMGSLDVLDATDVFWAGRLTLCAGPDDLERYDAAFAAYFGGEAPRAVPRCPHLSRKALSTSPSRVPPDQSGIADPLAPSALSGSRNRISRVTLVSRVPMVNTSVAAGWARTATCANRSSASA